MCAWQAIEERREVKEEMADWKKWLADLPATLFCILLITVIGIGVAHPGAIQKKQFKTAAHALSHLLHKSIRTV